MTAAMKTTVLQNACSDLVGAINNNPGPYAIGTTVMAMDALTTAAVYPAGSTFKITGSTQVYTTTAAFTTSAGAYATVTFTPGLVATAADNAVVTFEVMDRIFGHDQLQVHDCPRQSLTFSLANTAWGATVITPEGTVDLLTWFGIGVTPMTSATIATTITADGVYRLDVRGVNAVRLRVSTAGASGTTSIAWNTRR